MSFGSLSVWAQTAKKKIPDIPGEIMIDFGFNLATDNSQYMPYNWFRSKSFGAYFVKPIDVGKKLSFRPGIGVSLEKFGHASNPYVMTHLKGKSTPDSLGFQKVAGSIKKNQLAVNYIDIPLEFRYYFTGNNKDGGLFLAVGGSFAWLFESHTKIQYTDTFGLEKQVKDRTDFRQTKLRMGALGRLGYKSFSLFYKMYFTNMFLANGPEGARDMKYFTIGISFTGL